MRPKLSVVNSLRYPRSQRVNLARLEELDVSEAYAQRLEAALTVEDLPGIRLEDCRNRTKAAITSVIESVLRYVEPGRRNDWFYGECEAILANKEAIRSRSRSWNDTNRNGSSRLVSFRIKSASSVKRDGVVVPFSRNSQVLQEAQRFP